MVDVILGDMSEDDFGLSDLGGKVGLGHDALRQPSSLVRPGTSRSFFATSARSMARSACEKASAFVIDWPAARWTASMVTDHFQTFRPSP